MSLSHPSSFSLPLICLPLRDSVHIFSHFSPLLPSGLLLFPLFLSSLFFLHFLVPPFFSPFCSHSHLSSLFLPLPLISLLSECLLFFSSLLSHSLTSLFIFFLLSPPPFFQSLSFSSSMNHPFSLLALSFSPHWPPSLCTPSSPSPCLKACHPGPCILTPRAPLSLFASLSNPWCSEVSKF